MGSADRKDRRRKSDRHKGLSEDPTRSKTLPDNRSRSPLITGLKNFVVHTLQLRVLGGAANKNAQVRDFVQCEGRRRGGCCDCDKVDAVDVLKVETGALVRCRGLNLDV